MLAGHSGYPNGVHEVVALVARQAGECGIDAPPDLRILLGPGALGARVRARRLLGRAIAEVAVGNCDAQLVEDKHRALLTQHELAHADAERQLQRLHQIVRLSF